MSIRPHWRARLQLEELEARDLPSSALPDASYATDHIVVRWLNDQPAATPFATSVEALGNNTYDVNLAAGVSVAQAIDYYTKLAGVDFAQPDYIIQTAKVPNDNYVGLQWALNAINAPTAWNYTTGGTRILVAVIDTGVDYRDTDLAANIVQGYDFANNDADPMDDNGHGTHVSGIIGAIGNNGTGVAGVDWNVQIMPLKFMGADGQGLTSNAVKAVNYAVQMGAKIINNSWGGGDYDPAMAAAIQNAQNHGVIFVVAAGNNGTNNDTTAQYPADYAFGNVISVAATDQNNNLASFSNYGGSVTIAAPGVSILSTTPNNTYSYYSGTSMATPYVTGALALVWSLHPTWTYSEVMWDVVSNTDKLSSLTGKVGSGLLDVGKAISAYAPATPVQAATPVTPTTTPAQSSGPATASSGNVNLAIPDQYWLISTITISQHTTISSLTVNLNIQHTNDSNLVITLESPSGKQIVLFNRRGGSGQNLTNTTFTDSSPNAIYLAAAPFQGTVRPEYALSALKNTDAFGTWKLYVSDVVKGNTGTLLNWSLGITAVGSTKTASEGPGQLVDEMPAPSVAWIHVATSTVGEVIATKTPTPRHDSAQSEFHSTNEKSAVGNRPALKFAADEPSADELDRALAAIFVS